MKKVYKNLANIICMDQKQLKSYLYDFLIANYGESSVFSNDGYLFAEGEAPYTLVAHLDTVHQNTNTLKDIVCFNTGDDINFTSSKGIGGDDRCGVGIICELIHLGIKPTILFTEDEEIGSIGARKAVENKKIISIISNTNFIIELDRMGNNDAVFYGCKNEKFINFIKSCGWTQAKGMFSDICVIAPIANKAAVNISCGYYNQHTLLEYINMSDYVKVISRMKSLLLSKKAANQSFSYYEPIRK